MCHVSKMIYLFHLFIGINKSGGANYQSTGGCRYNIWPTEVSHLAHKTAQQRLYTDV